MIVRQRDYYRDRMGSKELLDPFIPHKSGASEDLVYKSDVFEPEKSYADPGFAENIWEGEGVQLIPFEAGLRRIAGEENIPWYESPWARTIGLVGWGTSLVLAVAAIYLSTRK